MKNLELRKKIKAKKPEFLRQDSHKKGEISNNWRKPKGLQSKMRLHKKGYRRSVEIGWKSPADVKGLHSNGLMPVNVSNISQLDLIKKETHGVVVSKTVGMKKKADILQKAKDLSLTVLNADIDAYLVSVKEKIEKKKEIKKAKEKKVKEAPKKEKKPEVKEKTEEEKKKEKDKILTQKQ